MSNRNIVVAAGLLALVALLWVMGVLGRGGQRPAQPNGERTEVNPPASSSPADSAAERPGEAGGPDSGGWNRLQALLGPCGPVGMGDSLCREPLPAAASLDEWARAKYLVLANKNWEVFDPEAWLAPFREVHRRPKDSPGEIVEELLALHGDNIELVIENFLTNREDASELKGALAAVFDGRSMAEMVIYAIGDGEALKGVLIVGRHRTGDEVTCAYHLWD